MVMVRIKYSESKWLYSAIYSSPTLSSGESLWRYMMHFRDTVHTPWFLIGEFNQVLLSTEVKGCTFSTSSVNVLLMLLTFVIS